MADYKKVVEVLGENLASLLELARKWLLDWSVDIRKLLHMLQNIRKNDLLGLIAETHEIKKIEIKPSEKFVLSADLGEIIVPGDFNLDTCLALFKQKNGEEFFHFNKDIKDANFSKTSYVLKPRDRFRVRIFRQASLTKVNFDECMELLETKNAVYLGAQGISLVFQQKHSELPKGCFFSFDKEKCLWKDSDGHKRIPGLQLSPNGIFIFQLYYFDSLFVHGQYIFCFNEIID